MVALLGVIILAGTVVNSSIVLIDYTLQRRQRGEDKEYGYPERMSAPCPSGADDRYDHYPRPCADGMLQRRRLRDDEADGCCYDDRYGYLHHRNAVYHPGLLFADRQRRCPPFRPV